MDQVSETLCLLVFRTLDNGHTTIKSSNPVIMTERKSFHYNPMQGEGKNIKMDHEEIIQRQFKWQMGSRRLL
jgi:hypothetical protein